MYPKHVYRKIEVVTRQRMIKRLIESIKWENEA